jgi:hypothetical protein
MWKKSVLSSFLPGQTEIFREEAKDSDMWAEIWMCGLQNALPTDVTCVVQDAETD